MIKDWDIKDAAGFDQSIRDRQVFTAGIRISRGMVVEADDAGRIGHDGCLKDFTRMNDGCIDAAARDLMYGHNVVLGIEHEDGKDFLCLTVKS